MAIQYSEQECSDFKSGGSGDRKTLPVGSYSAILDKAEAAEVGANKAKKLMLDLRVTAPELYQEHVHRVFIPLTTSVNFLKFVLGKFDIDAESIELPDIEGEMALREGWEVEFEMVQKGQYINANILSANKRSSEAYSASAVEVIDDIPF